MLRLNSHKDVHIEDYVPKSPVNPGAETTRGQRTWYRDSNKALINDKQILSLVNNLLLTNMGLMTLPLSDQSTKNTNHIIWYITPLVYMVK